MGDRRTRKVTAWRQLSAGMLLVGLCGCALVPPNSFLDPTKVGRFGLQAEEGGIRRVLSPLDTPPGLAHATEPTSEDLVPVYEEYRLGPGDQIAITIYDLLFAGQPHSAAYEVSSLGDIRLPELGTIRLSGLTEREVEEEIKARLRESGILPQPVVVVFTQLRRGRLFTAVGAVGAAGAYPISDPDLRLLEAIGMIGDVGATSQKMYVIRQAAAETGAVMRETAPATPTQFDEELVIPPPMDDALSSGGLMSGVGTSVSWQDPDQTPPTKDELESVLSPPAEPRPPASTRPRFAPLVFDPQTGEVIQTEPPDEPAEKVVAERPDADVLDEPFDWEDVEEYEFEQRVIEIDLRELKQGNARYNIVVRDHDVLNVPIDTGVFYLMGDINRPGVYSFGGRDITIKQAVAIAGGFSPLAWPSRCEVVRREPGTDKQLTIRVNLDAIFYGMEDDFYLRDDDIVNVGSHILAPFLFVIRNSFRFTYGFGFVYDRNFADKDAYGAKINPQTLEITRRQSSGLRF